MSYRKEPKKVFHRQRGIVDQHAISMLEPRIDGSDEGILATLIQLKFLGASAQVFREPEEQVNALALRGLLPLNEGTWSEVVTELIRDSEMRVTFLDSEKRLSGNSRNLDLWASRVSDELPKDDPGTWMLYGNGRALVGNSDVREIGHFSSEPSFIDAPTLTCGSSALIHRYTMEQGAFLSEKISDCWLTMTTRVDGVEPEDAVRQVNSRFGAGTATYTSDGAGSLVRFRIPLSESPESLLWQIDPERKPPAEPLASPIDVGPLPAITESGAFSFEPEAELPASIVDADTMVLGAGGLGAWAVPLILSGCDPRSARITIVDGDPEVEEHNLNRQVLYRSDDIGKPKAYAAKERILERFELNRESVRSFPFMLEAHHCSGASESDVEMIDIVDLSIDPIEENNAKVEGITEALDSMQVALSCLDNQLARTTLNRGCNDRGVTMVNGGCEGTVGLVEAFSGDSCMVCSYGAEEALSSEQISCQEEGTRPVSSIVTTSSYVGSMMACTALCILARQRGIDVPMPQAKDVVDGVVSDRASGPLPWFVGGCRTHL